MEDVSLFHAYPKKHLAFIIKELLDSKDLKPLVNFDVTDTENFISKKFNDSDLTKIKEHYPKFEITKNLNYIIENIYLTEIKK